MDTVMGILTIGLLAASIGIIVWGAVRESGGDLRTADFMAGNVRGGARGGSKDRKRGPPDPQRGFDIFQQELNDIIGLDSLKTRLVEFIQSTVVMDRESRILGRQQAFELHNFMFMGNPGTGKTTVAGIFCRILYDLQLVNKPEYEIVHSLSLKGQVIGETEKKTRDICGRNMGGVLVIDEAYQLLRGGPQDFGRQALDVLMQFSGPDLPNRPIIIMILYDELQRQAFINHNPGFERRFPREGVFHFDNYTPDQLVEIALVMMRKSRVHASRDVVYEIRNIISRNYASFESQNAGLIDTFVKSINLARRTRVFEQGLLGDDDRILEVTLEDVRHAAKSVF